MTEVAVSVAAKIAEYLVAPLTLPFRYLWNYRSNLENLKNEVNKLEARRETVQNSVADARRNGEEINKSVESWLESVKNDVGEASELTDEDKNQRAEIKCFKGFPCTNLKNRYVYSRKTAKLKDVVSAHEEAGKFDKVSHPTIPEQRCLQLSKEHQPFQTRNSILKDIIDAWSNPDINMIGIYGMGGVGKTTLAKEVAREVKKRNLFGKVVFVEVTESPDIKIIQEVIAENLGLEFKEKSLFGRANRLSEVLKKQEKLLLILDNIWGSKDLEKVGIPFDNDSKGLKLLLTARSVDVLKNKMNCNHNFLVKELNDQDAWSLFKNIAGTCIDHPVLECLASEVAKKCGGMPVAIVTIAKALKDKQEGEWRKALGELKKPSLESFEGIAKEVYTCIKLSYDHLESKELRNIFLLCSRMGRSYDASIGDLFKYVLGLGLLETLESVEEVLCNVHVLVNKLKDRSLLLEVVESERSALSDLPNSERFAMHDVVCYVARSIASREENVFNVIDDAIPRNWINGDKLRNCTSITLHNVFQLPKDLNLICPQLKFLYVKPKESFSRIPDRFFEGMVGLQVLHMIEINLRRLPRSLICLVDLRALCLDECKLDDIAVIGDLKKLEIVSFNRSEIGKLPEQMCHLTRLRLLDLSNCSKLSGTYPEVISSLTELEALYMSNVGADNTEQRQRRYVNIGELKRLHHLTILEMEIPNAKMSRGLLSPQLKRYKLCIGDDESPDWSFPYTTSRMLKFEGDNEDGIISQLKGIRGLELVKMEGIGNIYDLDRDGFPELKHLFVKSSFDCVYIVHSKQLESCDALPSLESLVVEYLDGLEKICNYPLGVNSFLQLTSLKVNECSKLNDVLSFSTDSVLPRFQEIEVYDCENMEQIFSIKGSDHQSNNIQVVRQIKFSLLSIVRLGNMFKLRSFCGKVKKTASPLQLRHGTDAMQILPGEQVDISISLFNDQVVLPNLQTLKIFCINHVERIWQELPTTRPSWVKNLTQLEVTGCDNLKELLSFSMVVMEEITDEERRDTISFPQLKSLNMGSLGQLTRLCSTNYIEFPSLKEFTIPDCPKLEKFLFDDQVVSPNLEILKIDGMDFGKIWDNRFPTMPSCVQNLTRLIINGCGHSKELFSSSMVNSFLQLQYLEIRKCPLLEDIMAVKEELREDEMKDTISFRQLNRLIVKDLANFRRLCSENYIEFPSLKEIEIQNCPKLNEFIFDDKVGVPSLEKMKISYMNSLKMIWHNQLVEASFCKLKLLKVSECPKLSTVIPSSMFGTLLSLECLDVWNCGSLEKIFDLQIINFEERNSIAAIQSQGLCLDDPQIRLSFTNLSVSYCRSLKNLFAASVIAREGAAVKEAPARFLFPKMTSLKLFDLPELRTFYDGVHDTDEEGQMQQSFFLEEFPCLERLRLRGKIVMMMWQGQVAECVFHKLRNLEVEDDESKVLPLGIIQRFHNLEHLSLAFGLYEEIFSYPEVQTQSGMPANIKKLVLFLLENLKCMWKQDSKLSFVLRNLEVLQISYCGSLINLLPPSASFQNLTFLDVFCCKSLINIGTSSMAKSLVQLTEMTVRRCENITEVIGNQRDVTEDKITFSSLKRLSLGELPSLTSFCSYNFTLEFPSLEELSMFDCPNMKIFSGGVLTTPTLWGFEIDEEPVELCPGLDLNTAIQQFHENAKSSEADCSGSFSHHLE